jgi:hypothetical protein
MLDFTEGWAWVVAGHGAAAAGALLLAAVAAGDRVLARLRVRHRR